MIAQQETNDSPAMRRRARRAVSYSPRGRGVSASHGFTIPRGMPGLVARLVAVWAILTLAIYFSISFLFCG